jgi:hypothetical protein
VNLTLTAANFTASWQQVQPGNQYTVNYLWPGSLYSGTFALARTSATSQIYEYKFPQCGRAYVGPGWPYDGIAYSAVTPYLRYDARTDPVTLQPRCTLTMFLTGLLEPKPQSFAGHGSSIPFGSNVTPTCTDSTTILVSTREWNLKNCGTRSVQLMDGKVCALDTTQSPLPGTPTVTVGDAVAANGEIRMRNAFTGPGHVAVRTNLTTQVITTGTYKEVGDPLLMLTNVTTTYG